MGQSLTLYRDHRDSADLPSTLPLSFIFGKPATTPPHPSFLLQMIVFAPALAPRSSHTARVRVAKFANVFRNCVVLRRFIRSLSQHLLWLTISLTPAPLLYPDPTCTDGAEQWGSGSNKYCYCPKTGARPDIDCATGDLSIQNGHERCDNGVDATCCKWSFIYTYIYTLIF